MGNIAVKMAESGDRPAILNFIAEHWQAQHIFVECPEVFDWQYRAPDGGYHMAIAQDGDEILGILGYIPTGRFDPELGFEELMLAIWKVRQDKAPPSLGLGLLKLIERTHSPSTIGAIGISDIVVPIYKAFKYSVGTLAHIALIPKRETSFAIAHNVTSEAMFSGGTDKATFTVMSETPDETPQKRIDLLAGGSAGLRKSWVYIADRYLQHPWYDYSLGTLEADGNLRAVLVWRRVEVNGAAILRIVDIIGDAASLSLVPNALAQLVYDTGTEYIDLLCCELDLADLRRAGFSSPNWHAELVLPNYFAPFEQRNTLIKYAYKADRPISLFRADSDQDRPNRATDLV